MYKIKKRSRKNIIGIKISGKLTAEVYGEIVPQLEELIRKYGKIRLLVELDHWEGWEPFASFKEMAFLFKNSFKLERVAIIVDSKSDLRAVLIDRPFSPWFRSHTRYFSKEEKEEAWEWIEEGVVFEREGITDLKEPSEKIRYGPKMDVLIVGGGATGMTIGALLVERGFNPLILEAEANREHYDIALPIWPTAGGVVKSLGVYKKLLEIGKVVEKKQLYDSRKHLLHEYVFDRIRDQFGDLIWVPYESYTKLLLGELKEEHFKRGIAVTKLTRGKNRISANFSNGTSEKFDLVICCDGLHSKMRELVFGLDKVEDTGIVGWSLALKNTWKIDEPVEYWESDRYIKLVPVVDRLYIIAGIKAEAHLHDKETKGIPSLKKSFGEFGGEIPDILKHVHPTNTVWHDRFYTLKSEDWVEEGVVMMGDAACPFLPMLEINKMVSLESAYILVDEVARSDSKFMNKALENYANRLHERLDGIRREMSSAHLAGYLETKIFQGGFDLKRHWSGSEPYINSWLSILDKAL